MQMVILFFWVNREIGGFQRRGDVQSTSLLKIRDFQQNTPQLEKREKISYLLTISLYFNLLLVKSVKILYIMGFIERGKFGLHKM